MIWLLYHSTDLDGHCSGAILRWYHEEKGLKKDIDFKMVGLDYGTVWDESQIQDGDTVYMSDISLQPNERMSALNKRVDLTVFDHHSTVVPVLQSEKIKGLWGEEDIAGCEQTWRGMIKTHIPHFIKLLSTWDCWKDVDAGYWNLYVKPFQMGMRLGITDPSIAEGWIFWYDLIGLDQKYGKTPSTMTKYINHIIGMGRVILQFTDGMNKDLMKRSFDMTFEGLRFIVVNGYKGSPQFDSKWDENKYDAMMSFYNAGNTGWTISMYTTKKELDLSKIAEKWGGGGHPKACGFRVDDIRKVIGDIHVTKKE
jgi:hypothetical protein